MKKFKVIFFDSRTGYDLYTKFECYAPSFMDLATRLTNSGVCFRLIEDVTRTYDMAEYSFSSSPWESIPEQAYLDSNAKAV